MLERTPEWTKVLEVHFFLLSILLSGARTISDEPVSVATARIDQSITGFQAKLVDHEIPFFDLCLFSRFGEIAIV